jgi:hypothetical protein
MAKIGYGYLCCSDYISFCNNYGQNRLCLPMLQVITLALVIVKAKIGYGYLCWSDYISFGNNYVQNWL